MKTLNRPMFKYGGPIKEGIMSGMKDNRQAINTVGSPLAPTDSSGRQGYAFPILGLAGTAGLQALRTGAMRAVPKIANFFRTQVGTKTVPRPGPTFIDKGKFVPAKNVRIPSSGTYSGVKFQPGKNIGTGTMEVPVYAPNFLGRDPVVRAIGGIYKGVTSPKAKGAFQKGAQYVFSPTGILTGAYFAGGKFFNSDGTEIENPEEKGLTPGGEITTGTTKPGESGGTTVVNKENLEQINKDRIQKTKERYYRLMGINKMNKDAIYDSLIDASKIIQEEGGDLKGAVKSGTLQNRIIQAISGQLDKSAALKKQIDAAVLKGEIEKDIAGAKPGSYLKQAQDYAAMKNVSVDQAYKDLGFDKRGDLFQGVQSYFTKNKVAPAGNDLATLARSFRIDVAGVEDTTTVKNKMKEKGYDEVGYLQEILSNPDAKVAPGNYIINTRVLNVDADKKITPVF